jgi:hypothetical protein
LSIFDITFLAAEIFSPGISFALQHIARSECKEESMQINKSTKTGLGQINTNESPKVESSPRSKLGVASIPDAFETSGSNSSTEKTTSKQEPSQVQNAVDKKSSAMEDVFGAFRKSVSDVNDDKSYYLDKLAKNNETAEAMSDYLKELVDQSGQLGSKEDRPDFPVSAQWAAAQRVKEAAKKRETELEPIDVPSRRDEHNKPEN